MLIGDVVGKPGRRITCGALPLLLRIFRLDFIVVNAENAAGGSGLTPELFYELVEAGAHCITMGDHIYARRQLEPVLRSDSRIVRPANYPAEAPGREYTILSAVNGEPVAVISLLGRVFMRPVDCFLAAADRVLSRLSSSVKVILVDFHAEATSDKQTLARYLDGRVSAVLGTHTHVPTADEQILPGGTAFQCDVGMTGPHESIIGRRIDRVLHTTRTFEPTPFDVATDDVRLNGTIVEVDPTTGKTQGIWRICLREEDLREAALSQIASRVMLRPTNSCHDRVAENR
ncbi:TIGR00282 family metallophosphoesterase [Thermogutta sp.]|uniref:TIGR00282 family metallophosphoesterase n=1 Tax=Thermogutta sp. TaxID=1962930 RepID=UPI00321FC402